MTDAPYKEPATRAEADIMTLQFLVRNPGHCIGTINTEAEMCAALVFADLQKRGLVTSDLGKDGPEFYITDAGMKHLKRNSHD